MPSQAQLLKLIEIRTQIVKAGLDLGEVMTLVAEVRQPPTTASPTWPTVPCSWIPCAAWRLAVGVTGGRPAC